jgi:hypothetical protein
LYIQGVGGWGQGTYCCPPTSNPDRGSTASMFSCLAMHTPNIAISSKPRGLNRLNCHDRGGGGGEIFFLKKKIKKKKKVFGA